MKILLIGSEGYIGNVLATELIKKHELATCDLQKSANEKVLQHYLCDFSKLTSRELEQYEVVINLAGHSSVSQCQLDPEGAIENNILNMMTLLNALSEKQILIYASSGSVYDGYRDTYPTEEAHIKNSRNLYDFTKLAGDYLVSTVNVRTIGLRFGTLSGYSQNMRRELIINRMTQDALMNSEIYLANRNSSRSCLSLQDLCNAVMAMLLPEKLYNLKSHEIFNLASFSMKIEDIAINIARLSNSKILPLPDSPTYDFSMSTEKFQRHFEYTFMDNIETIYLELTQKLGI
jgi:nucleoside-diphosphate-sugar epimerase